MESQSKRQIIITIKSEGKKDKVYDITKDLYVEDEFNLTRHMNEIAGHIAYFGKLRVDAEHEEKKLDDGHQIWLAQQKEEVENKHGKQKSETAKEEKVIVDKTDEFMKRRKELQDAWYCAAIMEVICKAFDAKREMLVSIGAQVRKDWEGSVVVTDKINGLNKRLEQKITGGGENLGKDQK